MESELQRGNISPLEPGNCGIQIRRHRGGREQILCNHHRRGGLLGCEGVMMWALFFAPAAACFIAYYILRRRLQRKLGESAFAGYFDED